MEKVIKATPPIDNREKASEEMKDFVFSENAEISKEWDAYHKRSKDIIKMKDDIAIAIIHFGLALKSLNNKLEELEKTNEKSPEDINIRFYKEFGKNYYNINFN